ncbi:MAG TPA: sugar ABC transporter ATP-binding protein [Streptosporangiaceae bacterium]|nr:sugar ABC transporter ATP-binding protein [Streptosporangiaceae bacterium]
MTGARPEESPSGEHRGGEHPAAEFRAGQPPAGEFRAGEHRAGEHRAGQHRAGQHRGGEHRGGEVRSGAARSGTAIAMRAGTDYEAVDITKSFDDVTVLHQVSVRFEPGEVHSVVGENGAGKSTLLKLMAGIYHPDSGSLVLGGETIGPLNPREAQRRGIFLVPQEPRLMPDLSVAENLYLGALARRRFGTVAWRAMNEATDGVISEVGLHVDPRIQAGKLSLAQQQLLECARALSHGCGIIFFDEPTSPLTAQDAEKLFALMDQLREQGLTLGFISHRLNEVQEISDRITVLRDGAVVAREERGTATRDALVRAMIGRQLSVTRRAESASTTARSTGAVMLDVSDLEAPPEVNGMSVRVRAGEIVGLAGLVGSGRTEFAETIFGLRVPTAGTVKVADREITGLSPRKCIDAGLVYLAEDRGRSGIFPDVDITRNETSAILRRLPRRFGLFIRPRKEQELARDAAERMDVRASSVSAAIKTLSGGNQQKALLARWMLAQPRVAVLDEPTRGVDIGAKESIYQIIESLAAEGLAVLVISSEMEDLIRVCDRVYAVYEGRITGELDGSDITLDALGHLVVSAS